MLYNERTHLMYPTARVSHCQFVFRNPLSKFCFETKICSVKSAIAYTKFSAAPVGYIALTQSSWNHVMFAGNVPVHVNSVRECN